MELINNTTKTLRDDLSVEIKGGSKLSIAAACFSIYAFQKLKKQLSDIDELRFIFTSPTFITEKATKEKREFYIPRLNRERSLYGTEFEIKLKNELTQKAIAKECAEWIKKRVTFKSNISDKTIQGSIVVDDVGYTPINNFTTIELGCEKGNVISTTIVKDNSLAKILLADFNEIWNNNKVLQEVTDEVIDSITAAYNENSPDFIYFVTLYNIFNEFLEDVSEDVLPNEATGFKDSKIWSMLYNFQKDAALAIINKLEKYNAYINEKLFVSELQYTTTIGRQKEEIKEYEVESGTSFIREKTRTEILKHVETSQIKYDLIGKVSEGTTLTRKTVSAILQGIRADKLYMFKNNPEEFITKVIRLINEQKATMIVEHISYDTIEGKYDSTIFTAEKNTQSFDKAFLAKKAIQDYVFTDGSAEKSIERRFAEDLDAAEEVCVYAKLPRTFQIPTPVGNYSPDWAIAFYEGTVKHIFFVAETKGTMETLNLRPIEQAKISCAKKLFNEMSNSKVVYHDVDSYQNLLNIINSI